MQTMIHCKTLRKGVHSFYLNFNGNDYLLFCQAYRKGVNNFYKNGVRFDESRNYSKAKGDSAVIRTMDKILMYVKYIEREYKIQVLDKTKAKNIRYMGTKMVTNFA